MVDVDVAVRQQAARRAGTLSYQRGFGNEFWVEDPSAARVVKVMTTKQAKAFDRTQRKYLPNSEQELRAIYDRAVGLS